MDGKKGTFGDYLQPAQTEPAVVEPVVEVAENVVDTASAEPKEPATVVVDEGGKLKEGAEPSQAPANQPADEPIDTYVFDMGQVMGEESGKKEGQTEAPATSWKDEVKKVPLKDLAELVGLDPFVIELNEHIKNGGAAYDYLAAKAVDYNKISDTDLLRSEFSKKYAHLSEDEQAYLFNKKYSISEFDDEDTQKEKQIALKADAYEVRQQRIAEQSKFKIKESQPQQTEPTEEEVAYQKQIEKDLEVIKNHEVTNSLINSKRVTVNVGEGVPPFNFNIPNSPERLLQVWDSPQMLRKVLDNGKGELDVPRLLKASLALFDPNYEKTLVDYGRKMGMRNVIAEGQNAKKPNGRMPVEQPNKVEVTATKGKTFGMYGN